MTAQIRRLEHEARVLEQKQEIKRLEKELAELNADDDDDDDEIDTENMLMNTLLTKFMNPHSIRDPNQGGEISPIPPMQVGGEISLSDQQIEQTLAGIPRSYLKMARNMPDDAIKAFINKQGNFSQETINRAITRLRNI